MRNLTWRGAVVALASAALIVTPAAPSSAIVGGAPDAGEHPYVGQLLFYVPNAVDSRFDDPGGWFNCTGTLIDSTTVVTAGHCTYDVGLDGVAPEDPLFGGNDIWFSVEEAPDYDILDPSSTYVPDGNAERYADWSAALDASPTWHETEVVYTHPDYVDAQFLLHDLGVFKLSEPIVLDEYGSLPSEGYLDQYDGRDRQRGLFESVGYGLEKSGPKTAFGGDTRRKADRRLVSIRGAYGYRDIAVMFSHRGSGTTGGTCFGDSGGPTFDITTPEIEAQNIIVAVTSFGMNYNCNASGSYRIDQEDDLSFLMDPAGSYDS
ncbi:trypsin-like serine protease [Nocardioides seonyuensis]|uniref:Trypsin-like serine protease n=1 Tax=Nocardioides seonyuensis TaxID=2518371 RepID=A0A4P7IBI1_9ACTN|nr:trypsin-like serine protease [Nocardioides seonyuensis]QBX54389.1 trypsin-like serine protease [Nocardioides seonyuensis]